MAVYINNLNGGNITIGAGGGGAPAIDPALTKYKYAGDTSWRTIDIDYIIEGAIPPAPTSAIPNITEVVAIEVGTSVELLNKYAFYGCTNLKSITVPTSVMDINALGDPTSGLTDITLSGRTIQEAHPLVYWMDDDTERHLTVPEGCVIHCTDGDITFD